jgi:Protein of unknown function (DUF3309)
LSRNLAANRLPLCRIALQRELFRRQGLEAGDIAPGGHTMSLTTLLIIILLVLLLGGFFGHRRYGGRGLGGVLGLVLIIVLILWLVGGVRV